MSSGADKLRVVPVPAFDSTDYRRCARRLRHLHRSHPARLARSLRELSLACDACSPPAPLTEPRLMDHVRAFAQQVCDELEGTTLRYSKRVMLLRDARRRGIRRFDANLIIASVQERLQGSGVEVPQARPHRTWRSCAAVVIVVQGLILAGATYVLGF
jgi:hypothetical protein